MEVGLLVHVSGARVTRPRRLAGRRAALTAWAAGLCVALPVAAAPPTPEQIESAVRRLGDDRFEAREEASAFLWAAGVASEPPLREALHSDDPEVVTRAREILDRFKYGIFSDTPPALAKLLARYRAGDARTRERLVFDVAALGPKAHAALLRLYAGEDNPNVRNRLLAHLAQRARDIVPQLLIEGNPSLAEELLEQAASINDDGGKRNYAAYLFVRGRLDDAIDRCRELAQKTGDAQRTRALGTLAYLLRAKADLAGARAAAEKAEDATLVESLLYEQGDWTELARRADEGTAASQSIESLGFRAAFHRLAGHAEAFAKALDEIRRYAAGNPNEHGFVAEAYFLNDRPEEGLDIFLKHGRPHIAFELLCAQLRYREAFAVAEAARGQGGSDLPLLNLQVAQVLHRLGAADQALGLFREGTAAAIVESNFDLLTSWLDAALRAGLTEFVVEEAARALPTLPDEDHRRRLLGRLHAGFAGNHESNDHAWHWWLFLRRRHADESPAKTLERLRRLLDRRPPDPDLQARVREVELTLSGMAPDERDRWLETLAWTWENVGRNDLARPYLGRLAERDAGAEAHARFGHVLAGEGRWAEAAERYGRAWESDRARPLHASGPAPILLYLQGWALTRAGREREGRERMELARLLPLGDDRLRHALAEALTEQGLSEAAARERQVLLRTGEFLSWHHDDAVRKLANAALARQDYATGLLLWNRFLLNGLRTNTAFAGASAYLEVPAFVHRHRARACLAADDADGALREADSALAAMPGDVEIPIALVPELERRGMKTDAAAVFSRVFDRLEGVCKAYPGSAATHNQAAWLAARCRCRLDAALAHARKAVELAPKEPPYIDTLAEAHFQREEAAQAIERMQQCLALDPTEGYYRRQLSRFRAGNRDTAPE